MYLINKLFYKFNVYALLYYYSMITHHLNYFICFINFDFHKLKKIFLIEVSHKLKLIVNVISGSIIKLSKFYESSFFHLENLNT